MRIRVCLIAGILLLASCHIGAAGRDLAVARGPGGASVIVETLTTSYQGELIAVQDSGVVLSRGKLFFVGFPSISEVRADGLGADYRISHAELNDPAKVQRLRLVSHFPQGMTPGIQRALLAQTGQESVETVR
ncbi:MAG: hypothetical protein ABR582_11220 [Gemmatimonadaceae bacterium]